jgi:hypothetical protein
VVQKSLIDRKNSQLRSIEEPLAGSEAPNIETAAMSFFNLLKWQNIFFKKMLDINFSLCDKI